MSRVDVHFSLPRGRSVVCTPRTEPSSTAWSKMSFDKWCYRLAAAALLLTRKWQQPGPWFTRPHRCAESCGPLQARLYSFRISWFWGGALRLVVVGPGSSYLWSFRIQVLGTNLSSKIERSSQRSRQPEAKWSAVSGYRCHRAILLKRSADSWRQNWTKFRFFSFKKMKYWFLNKGKIFSLRWNRAFDTKIK